MKSIRLAVSQADAFLASCAQDKVNDAARLRNLEEVMKRGARLAWLFFSQPATFAADWTCSDRSSLVIYPGLVQVCDNEGCELQVQRVLGQVKEVAQI